MNQKITSLLAIITVLLIGAFIFWKAGSGKLPPASLGVEISNISLGKSKNFTFDSFHGSKNINLRWSFEYPASWQNDGQYFSSQKIEYYDLYSVMASFYFDLIRLDIYDQTDFKYQIDQSKRRAPDTNVIIDGQNFKRYDLTDYGSYGGESAGRVIIYVGPDISVDGDLYKLVFHWEERPLTSSITGNNPEVFDNSVKSLKFY